MRRPWFTVLIFLVGGPPVGLAVLWGLMMLHDRQLIFPVRIDFLLASYVFGGVQALIAGIWVAAMEKPTFWRVSRAGLVVGAIFALLLALSQLRWLPGMEAKAIVRGVAMLLILPVTICFIPTLVCWRLARLLGTRKQTL